jgi:hypothetical protein
MYCRNCGLGCGGLTRSVICLWSAGPLRCPTPPLAEGCGLVHHRAGLLACAQLRASAPASTSMLWRWAAAIIARTVRFCLCRTRIPAQRTGSERNGYGPRQVRPAVVRVASRPPSVSRVRLPSASTRLLRQPGGGVLSSPLGTQRALTLRAEAEWLHISVGCA